MDHGAGCTHCKFEIAFCSQSSFHQRSSSSARPSTGALLRWNQSLSDHRNLVSDERAQHEPERGNPVDSLEAVVHKPQHRVPHLAATLPGRTGPRSERKPRLVQAIRRQWSSCYFEFWANDGGFFKRLTEELDEVELA